MLQRGTTYSRVAVQRAADKEQLSDIEGKEGCNCWEEEGSSLSKITGLLLSFDCVMQKFYYIESMLSNLQFFNMFLSL